MHCTDISTCCTRVIIRTTLKQSCQYFGMYEYAATPIIGRRINWYHRDQDLKLAEQRRQIKGNNKPETENQMVRTEER